LLLAVELYQEVFCMADDTKQTVQGTEQDTQPVTPPTGQQATPGTSAQKYVTEDQLKQWRDNTLSTVQSMIGKSQAKVQKRMQDFEAGVVSMKQAGKEFTPEEENVLRAKAYSQAVAENQPDAASMGEQPVQAATQQTQAMDQVQLEAQRLQQAAGVTLVDGDPELTTNPIVYDQGVYAFLRSVEQAAQAKKMRLSLQPQTIQAESAARMPNVGVKSQLVAQSAAEYWDKAYKKK
jgi:hypothetical protein